MSYGADGRWTLVPFTNDHTDGTDITIECDNDHGDVFPGRRKYCCYHEAGTGFDGPFEGHLGENGGAWYFSDGRVGRPWTMRYGTGSRFTYRVIDGKADGHCTNSFFNDPAYGHRKHCNYRNEAYMVPRTESDWTICGNEGGECSGLDQNTAQWVRYGDDDHYYLRLVISSNDGKVPCSDAFFEDPISGSKMHCWRGPAEYTFTDVVGQWEQLRSCAGCSSNEYTIAHGVTVLEEKSVTEEFSVSLTTTLSAGFTFQVGDVSAEVSATVGGVVAHSMTNSLEQSLEKTSTFTCERDRLFQWTTSARLDNGISSTDFAVMALHYRCLDEPLTPQCPPTYCADDDCQQCTDDITFGAQMEPVGLIRPVPASEWSLADWYHAHYQALILFLASTLVLFCGLNLYVMARSGDSNNKAYAAVKYMESETEMDVEAKPIKM